MPDVSQRRRLFLGTATAGLSSEEFAVMGAAYAAAKLWKPPARRAPLNADLAQESPQAFDDAVLALVKR